MSNPDRDALASRVTRLLERVSAGDRTAFDELLPLVYDEMKRIAHHRLSGQRPGHTLNTTALVHETYLKMCHQDPVEWQGRSHFLGIASHAMRQVLIDYAKMRQAAKRGGGAPHESFEDHAPVPGSGWLTEQQATDLIALGEALDRLREFDARGAEVVQYRFFGGLTNREIAELLGTSEVTVRRAWAMAKTWLRQELGPVDFALARPQ